MDGPGLGLQQGGHGEAGRIAPALVGAVDVQVAAVVGVVDGLAEEAGLGLPALAPDVVGEAHVPVGSPDVAVGPLHQPDGVGGGQGVEAERLLELADLDQLVLEALVAQPHVLDGGGAVGEVVVALGHPVLAEAGLEADAGPAQLGAVGQAVLVAAEPGAVQVEAAAELDRDAVLGLGLGGGLGQLVDLFLQGGDAGVGVRGLGREGAGQDGQGEWGCDGSHAWAPRLV